MQDIGQLHEHIIELVNQGFWGQISSEFSEMQPADIAEAISSFQDESLRMQIFKTLSDTIKPDVLAELPPEISAAISENLSSEEASDIVDEMDPDDAADVLAEMDKSKSSQIIERMDEDNADDVRMLLSYPEDSAGGIMTTNLISVREDNTVLETLDKIATDDDGEHIFQVYVVDEGNRLKGVVAIWQLLRQKDRAIPISGIMNTETFAVRSDADQEEVAHIMSKYSLSVIPVVDGRGVLLGRITHDDVLDVIQEEAEEDIFMLAGSDDEDLGNDSIFKSCMIRLPWLSVTLVGGIITSSLINLYTEQFNSMVVLAAFIPNVMAMGGNTGLQSSILLIREITAGNMRKNRLLKLIRHELSTGALMGVLCGAGIFIWALILILFMPFGPHHESGVAPWYLAGVVAVALFCAMSFAAVFGAIVPVALEKFKIDPAVASGPFISVMNDISALLIYYGISSFLLLHVLSKS